MLIGNKYDLVSEKAELRKVNKEDVADYIEGDMRYMETSAKTGHQVRESFEQLIQMIYDQGTNNPGNKFGDDLYVLTAPQEKKKEETSSDCCS